MKMSKLILAGALVLLASVVFFSCKPEVTSDPTIGEETAKGWKIDRQENTDPEAYWRWMRQHKGNNSYTSATMALHMTNYKAGKIGFIFGLTETEVGGQKTGKYNYYQIGFGAKKGTDELEYYVQYYKDVDITKVSGGSVSDGPDDGTSEELVGSTSITGTGYIDGSNLNVAVKMDYDEATGYTLIFAPTADKLTDTNVATTVDKDKLNDTTKVTTASNKFIKGGAGYYAMLTMANAGNVSSTFEWSLDSSTRLSAEDAE